MKTGIVILACFAAGLTAMASAQSPQAPPKFKFDLPRPTKPLTDRERTAISKFQLDLSRLQPKNMAQREELDRAPPGRLCLLGAEPCITNANPPRTYAEPYRGDGKVLPLQR